VDNSAVQSTGRLGPGERDDAWQRLGGEHFDLVVVGGGVVGAGVALDAATRGLRTALVEARDLASGASSRSSKLIHGGLRHLRQLRLGLVREALAERELLLTVLAPHLVRPVSLLYPLRGRVWERAYAGAGLALYDTIGGARSLPRHRHLTRGGALRLVPALRRDAVIGAIRYSDAITDDARHTMTLARTAAHYGAVVRSSTQVVGLIKEGNRISGVRLLDCETGEQIDLVAHVVVNCTGVWTDELQRLSGERDRLRVRASKNVHVVVPRDRIVGDSGLLLGTEFVIPWGNHWILGTTDTDWKLDLSHPAATRSDIDHILGSVNKVLATPLTHGDIDGVYAGLRPLLAGEHAGTSTLSRKHAVVRVAPGLLAVAGGNYTTYRVMAADAVNAAGADLPARIAPSITGKVGLLGADGYPALVNQIERLASRYRLHPYRVRHLLDRYGSLIHQVLALADGRRALLSPLAGAPDYLSVEIVYAASHEGALHLEDVLARRTRISIEYPHRGVDSARAVADLMAPVLDWDAANVEREIKLYNAQVDAERESQNEPDDTAAAKRSAAPEARPHLREHFG
jgi:glycerol-3-phosphate dehydrogenase